MELIPAALTGGSLLVLGGRAAVHNGRTAVESSGVPLHVHLVRAIVRERGARVLDVPVHYRRRLARVRQYSARHGLGVSR